MLCHKQMSVKVRKGISRGHRYRPICFNSEGMRWHLCEGYYDVDR